MGMAGQIERHPCRRGLFDDFRGVHQRYIEAFRRRAQRFERADRVIIMHVVDAGQVNLISTACQAERFIGKHPDAELFERLHHVDGIVIAQNAENPVTGGYGLNQFAHGRQDCIKRAPNVETIIPGQNTGIDG